MTISLITLDKAKRHLQIPTIDHAHDADILFKAQMASGLLLKRLEIEMPDELGELPWDPIPEDIQGFTCMILENLYYNRGSDADLLPRQFDRVLSMYRDPTTA